MDRSPFALLLGQPICGDLGERLLAVSDTFGALRPSLGHRVEPLRHLLSDAHSRHSGFCERRVASQADRKPAGLAPAGVANLPAGSSTGQERQVETATVGKPLACTPVRALQPALDLLHAELFLGSHGRFHFRPTPAGAINLLAPQTLPLVKPDGRGRLRTFAYLCEVPKKEAAIAASEMVSGGAGGNRTPVRKPLSGRSTRLAG
jgi:hypothetical protein